MIYCIIILLIFSSEIVVKDYIERNREYANEKMVLNGKVSITKQYNKGMCMNLFENNKKIVNYLSSSMLVAVLLFFFVKLPKKGGYIMKLGLSFIIGGALSNLCDRLMKGHVIDYLIVNFKKLKNIVFNLADVFIFLGAALVTLSALFHKKR